MRTVRLGEVSTGHRHLAAHNVLGLGDRLEMVRVDAVPNPAQMVYRQAPWNGTHQPLINDSMNPPAFVVAYRLPVTVLIPIAGPQPARLGNVHASEDTRYCR